MKSKSVKVVFLTAIVMIGGINVFNAQKSETLSDIALANVEALASDSESSGIDWSGHVYDWENRCCKNIYRYEASCSGAYKGC